MKYPRPSLYLGLTPLNDEVFSPMLHCQYGARCPAYDGCGVWTGPSTPDESGNYNLKCVTFRLYHFNRMFGWKIVKNPQEKWKINSQRSCLAESFRLYACPVVSCNRSERSFASSSMPEISLSCESLIFVDRKVKNRYNGS